jgi:hypothetical protein
MKTGYGSGAIVSAEENIHAAPESLRNNTLYAQARGCFELAAGGELGAEEVWERLAQAGSAVGLDRAEIKATLRSAHRDGLKKPRRAPDSNGDGGTTTFPPMVPSTPPTYPPLSMVRALWDTAESVFAHDEACAFVEDRRISLERMSGAALCRYLPKGAALPKDLRGELREVIPRINIHGEWRYAPLHGFRLLFPLYDSLGNVRSLQLRCTEDYGPDVKAKSVSMKPQKRGLVLANNAGAALLRRDPERAKFWADRPLEVVIVEGEPDLLVAACEDIDEARVRAVLGITGNGSWSDAHVLAIPEDATVVIATDNDIPGNQYAAKIAATLGERSVARWTPNIEGQDVCDAGGLVGGTYSC